MKAFAKILGVVFIVFAAMTLLSQFDLRFLSLGTFFDLIPIGLINYMGFPDREAFNEVVQPYLSATIGLLLALAITLLYLSQGPKRKFDWKKFKPCIAPHYGMRVFLKVLFLLQSLSCFGFFGVPLLLSFVGFPTRIPEFLGFVGSGLVPYLIGIGAGLLLLLASSLIRLRKSYEAKNVKKVYFGRRLKITYPKAGKKDARSADLAEIFQDIYNDGYTIVEGFEPFQTKEGYLRIRVVFRTELTRKELKEQFKRRHKAFIRKTAYGLDMPTFYSDSCTFKASADVQRSKSESGPYHRYEDTYRTTKTTYSDGSTKTSTTKVGRKDMGLYKTVANRTMIQYQMMKDGKPFLQEGRVPIMWTNRYESSGAQYIGK